MIVSLKLSLTSFFIFIIGTFVLTDAVEVDVDTLWTEDRVISRCTSVVSIAEAIPKGYPIKIGVTNKTVYKSFFIDSTFSGASTAKPPANDYHNIAEWFAQRYCNIIEDINPHKTVAPKDWSNYNFLRFDAYSEDTTAILGVRIKDASDYEQYSYNEGNFSAIGTFVIPKGGWVTCNFPLKEMAEISELQLNKMQGFLIQVNGFCESTYLQMRNIRLVGSGTNEYPLVGIEENIRPFGRKVCIKPQTVRDKAKLKRNLGAVDTLGPITIVNSQWGYANSNGHFGGAGVTYQQNVRRGIVAYDNDRLLLVMKAQVADAIIPKPGSDDDGTGSIVAMGSFDGGETWGGIAQGESRPTYFTHWYTRAHGTSDFSTGDYYHIGTQNCSSYHGVVDIFFRRLAFTGSSWYEERFAIVDQIECCPKWSHALRMPSGRIWTTNTDGHGTVIVAKHSDDDGFTFGDIKDADKPLPRPWYRPGIDPIPENALLFAGTRVPGHLMASYGDSIAFFSYDCFKWKVYDGENWSSTRDMPTWCRYLKYGTPYFAGTATTIEEKKIFLAKGGNWSPTNLVVTHLEDGAWMTDTLVQDSLVLRSILTASGNSVFCFYVEQGLTEKLIKYRKYQNGVWESPVQIAAEVDAVNHLAAPMVCPPTYACVFWDQSVSSPFSNNGWVRYMRIPSGNRLTIATLSLDRGVKGIPYSAEVEAACGIESYTYAFVSGNLPDGITLAADGEISGIPTDTGRFIFSVKVTDSNFDTASKTLSLRIVSDLSVDIQNAELAKEYGNLLFCHPNPFSSMTSIKYEVSNKSKIKIQIYNISGKLVKTAVDGVMEKGRYSIVWQTKGIASGIYFIKLKTPKQNLTKKIIFM